MGTRIFLGGGVGYVAWEGTQFKTNIPYRNGVPSSAGRTLAVIGDLRGMDADGTTDGYDIKLTQLVADSVDIPVIASGGCGSPEHIYQVFEQTNASAALAASIFHYGTYTVGDVKKYLADRGVLVR